MKNKIKTRVMEFVALIMLAWSILLVSAQAADYTSSTTGSYQTIGSSINTQYYRPGTYSSAVWTPTNVYWPEFNREVCRERQDFIVQVLPGGCQPAVVRSDLLEEQNAPVFCKIMLIQTNPLIDVSRVKTIRFPGTLPKGVAGITYFPPRYNLMQRNNIADTPIDDNIGYFVVSLKKTPNEKDMPDWIEGNLTAIIDYDVESALGTGRTNFYVSEVPEEDWLRDYKFYSFWNGKAYLKTESIESDRVTVSVYRDFDTKEATLNLKKGETSAPIYLGGFYCAAGLKVTLEDVKAPVETALLQIGDDTIWVAKNDKIMDNQCTVNEVKVSDSGGKVTISCPVTNGKFDLSLNYGKVNLTVGNGLEGGYGIGKEVVSGKSIYLAYSGTWKSGKDATPLAVIVSDPWVKTELGFQEREIFSIVDKVVTDKNSLTLTTEKLKEAIQQAVIAEYNKKVPDSKSRITKENVLVLAGKTEGTIKSIALQGDSEPYTIKLGELESLKNKEYSEDDPAYVYYKKAIQSYKDLADFYPQEKRLDDDYFEPYAAEAIHNGAILAQQFGMIQDREEFYSRLRSDYPDSSWTTKTQQEIDSLKRYDTRESRAVVSLRDGSYFVSVLGFKRPTKDTLGVDLMIKGEEKRLGLNEIWKSEDAKETIQVTKIEDDKVELVYNGPAVTGSNSVASASKTETLVPDKKDQVVFGTMTVRLLNIDIEKQAKIVLDSEEKGPRAYANFSFKIGIEKRGIQLSPEKTKEMMENIEESIKKWEDINEKLGKVVKGLKGACFATSAILTAKNLVTGFSGEAMARGELMTMPGGWNDHCEKLVNEGKYYNIQACLLDKNSEIESDVNLYAAAIKNTNDKLEQARQGLTERTDILDIEGQVTDREQMESKFRNYINCQNLQTEFNADTCKDLSFEDTKTIYTINTALSSGGSEVMKNALQDEKNRTEESAQMLQDWKAAKAASDLLAKSNGWTTLKRTNALGETTTPAFIEKVPSKKEDIPAGTDVMMYFIPQSYMNGKGESVVAGSGVDVAGSDIIIGLTKDPNTNTYTRDKYYTLDGKEIPCTTGTNKNCEYIKTYLASQKIQKLVKTDAKAYENKIKNPEKLTVKYFERAPYKGLPAEVPFDVQNGWYVEMEYVLSGFGKPYDESGRVANFYICNVGSNGLIEFKRNADDICRYYNGISDELGFPGLDAAQSRTLVARAKQAIVEASKYYGKKEAFINGEKFGTGTSFGGESGRCTDFMSPKDCNMMFNVCDPVICPSSRCDLGGTFPVDNVIQTGIIGSLVLCLPNLKEGIYIPVCLSGVHAGIEGYLSILKAHRDCLNESLTTGKTIGICDEIRSIYLCEFFWRQMVPFFDVIVPRLVESFMGQGARGGGEYLTVQSAWDNTQKSIDYFNNEYAVNSMNAFQMRSTEEAGSEVCQSFVSTRFPTDFDLLTEPDSPAQYHAWFDENILTTATPYPTSHYKVYYHIYAGNDQGAYYAVYLKDISDEFSTRYTYQSDYYVVPDSQDYLPAGESVDVARDFTAPSGYKQLCININGQDECGFGKVSTSFAVDYISDKYAAEQAEENIKTSKECVAGTPSLYSLGQPNLQAGAEEAVEPELYNQGIVRVCSTYNPGRQVDANGEYDTTNSTYDRWKDVGYCDDTTLRCWLDTESVKDVIKNKQLEQQVLSNVTTSAIGSMDALTYENSRGVSSEGEELIKTTVSKVEKGAKVETVDAAIKTTEDKFKELSELAPSNPYKARGLLLLGKLYDDIAIKLKGFKTTSTDTAANVGTAKNVQVTNQNNEVVKNTNTGDSYPEGYKLQSQVDGSIWTKQADGKWKSDTQTQPKDYSELGGVFPYTPPSQTSTATSTTSQSILLSAVNPTDILKEKSTNKPYTVISSKPTGSSQWTIVLSPTHPITGSPNDKLEDKGFSLVGGLV